MGTHSEPTSHRAEVGCRGSLEKFEVVRPNPTMLINDRFSNDERKTTTNVTFKFTRKTLTPTSPLLMMAFVTSVKTFQSISPTSGIQ